MTTRLAALYRIAADVLGEAHEFTITHRDQLQHWLRPPGLDDKQMAKLQGLLTTTSLRELHAAPDALMREAENYRRARVSRLASANLAAGLRLQLDLLLKPGRFAALRVNFVRADGTPDVCGNYLHLPTQVAETDRIVALHADTRQLLARRADVRQSLLAPHTTYVFPARRPDQHQTPQGIQMALGPAVERVTGLKGVTVGLLRDLGAALLLDDNKDDRGRVADVLDYKEIRAVERRFAPLLKGVDPVGSIRRAP